MKIRKTNFKKPTVFHIILLGICILCIMIIFYWRHKTTLYHYMNEEVYIDEISENKIIVKGLPYTTGNFKGEYVIQINDALIMKDHKGGDIDIYSLERGDIILFDYSGPFKLDNGTVLNGKKTYAYNFRISEDKINLKFWHLE